MCDMPDLDFEVLGAGAVPHAAAPTLCFQLRAREAGAAGEGDGTPTGTPIHSVVLRCQIRIEPARRHYGDDDHNRLFDLFGRPQQWGQTLRPMLWTHATA